MPGSGRGALVDVDKLGQTRRSVSLPSLDDVRVRVEGSSRPHKAATLGEKYIYSFCCQMSIIGFTNICRIKNIRLLKNLGAQSIVKKFSQNEQSETTKYLISPDKLARHYEKLQHPYIHQESKDLIYQEAHLDHIACFSSGLLFSPAAYSPTIN